MEITAAQKKRFAAMTEQDAIASMSNLHILTAPNGKHLLIGERWKAADFARKYGEVSEVLDSVSLGDTHYVEVSWLVENQIKKVIHI